MTAVPRNANTRWLAAHRSRPTLVASTGLLVLLLGLAVQIWGLQARANAPSLVPSGPIDLPACQNCLPFGAASPT